MNDGKILIIMPTRGRPWSALEAIASLKKTAAVPDMVTVVICVDDDDPDRFVLTDNTVHTISGPRKRLVGWVNFACKTAALDFYSHVAWFGDDCRMITPGWDVLVQGHEQLVVYGPDGIHNEKMATHPFIRTEIPRALGYLAPAELTHGCPDIFIQELGRELNSITYNAELKLEHLHYVVGKSSLDATYSEALPIWPMDRALMREVIRPRIPILAAKVKALL